MEDMIVHGRIQEDTDQRERELRWDGLEHNRILMIMNTESERRYCHKMLKVMREGDYLQTPERVYK